jgi:23S rRNA (uracil1939-C5)-methyltransferase
LTKKLARKKRNLPRFENVFIEDIGSKGKSIVKVDGQVIFVTKALPGDIVDLQVIKKKRNYLEAIPVTFHQLSEKRTTPFCKHFGVCGGCKWQDLKYSEQLKYKQQEVIDNFERIGKVSIQKSNDILPSGKVKYYRNKLEFTFSSQRWFTKEELDKQEFNKPKQGLGLHTPGRWDKVVDLEECFLQPSPSNEIRLEIRKFAIEKNFSFFDLRKQEGFLRNLIIRTSSVNELMVIMIFYYEDKEAIEMIMQHVAKTFPEITSLMYMINNKKNDSIYDLDPVVYAGQPYIIEEMEGLKFKIGPKSFFQTNSLQAYELYKLVRKYANLKGNEIVYDLYTGTGTIANFIAPECKKIIGIESVPEAIEDAKENSAFNDIKNAEFLVGDMKDILNDELFEEKGKPDVIIADPPRAGMHKKVVENILKALPSKIVYVSCNPATQARDVNLLKDSYEVSELQPVDMFPHTYHVENIVLLTKL